MPRCTFPIAGLIIAILHSSAMAQQQTGRFYPLDHRQVPGTAAQWQAIAKPGLYGYMQPVRISLPGDATVSYFNGSPHANTDLQAPAQARMMVGHVYRVRLSAIAGHPGLELFPTIEVLDRLHPPEGKLDTFPIPIEITEEELTAAAQDRLVTKVIYLEHPQTAAPVTDVNQRRVEEFDPRLNLLEAADVRGRPMAILRMGGRIPDPNAPTDEFYSTSPLQITALPPKE